MRQTGELVKECFFTADHSICVTFLIGPAKCDDDDEEEDYDAAEIAAGEDYDCGGGDDRHRRNIFLYCLTYIFFKK